MLYFARPGVLGFGGGPVMLAGYMRRALCHFLSVNSQIGGRHAMDSARAPLDRPDRLSWLIARFIDATLPDFLYVQPGDVRRIANGAMPIKRAFS
ncbi:hypothetical protein [Ralstonia solanacearum]|uniref:hypothetical protein n=1 Tax=Ralstonia solanacearum TaxID=305 RepID=UPI003AF32BEB